MTAPTLTDTRPTPTPSPLLRTATRLLPAPAACLAASVVFWALGHPLPAAVLFVGYVLAASAVAVLVVVGVQVGGRS